MVTAQVEMPDAAPPIVHIPPHVVEPVSHHVTMPDAGAPDAQVDATPPEAGPDAPDSAPPPPSCTTQGYDCGSSACCDGMSCVNVGFGLVCETPEDHFALAACTHIGCPGWATAQDTCLVSFRAAMQRLDPQDPGCLERAAKALVGASCSEAGAIADPVTAWKGMCQR